MSSISELENAPEYPEHEKLDKVKDKSQDLGFFLDWLMNDYTLCIWIESKNSIFGDDEIYEPSGYYSCKVDIEKILANYFGIDYDKLMDEKEQMFKQLRAQMG